MKGVFKNFLGIFAKAWWLEVSTTQPSCVYYFGPFDSEPEATQAKAGYISDLESEGSKVTAVAVTQRATPEKLTVEGSDLGKSRSLAVAGRQR
jgi:Domain of unknown function (DUF1816)